MVRINKGEFFEKLCVLMTKRSIEKNNLMNHFLLYFATFLDDILGKRKNITIGNYVILLEVAINNLRQAENKYRSGDIAVLISKIQKKEGAEQRIISFMLREKILLVLADKEFVEKVRVPCA